ncbi:ATP-binding cassette domain-containing protein [Rhizobium sp. FKL33]|uniref:P-loop ATPase, Sll1717 family n=1 Tax=Rhizobium sp. FKL33 TaxID=2562307 RepID=UPI0010C0B1D0|nr:ATP-binding cassette domain-containing protein [Rhizobium sp. FKL33]
MNHHIPIPIEELQFGERDAFHEFIKQDKQGSSILDNAFVVPPRIKLNELNSGARTFIVGPKGSGKTTLMLHLRRHQNPAYSGLVLFKSHIRKEDRDALDKMTNIIVVEDQHSVRPDADYKTVWEWYILKNVFRLIPSDAVLSGLDVYRDISVLLEVDNHKFNTIYDKMYVERAKGSIKVSVDFGALKSELGAEVEARRTAEGRMQLLDLVRIIIHSLRMIKLKHDRSVRLYFDELEFFMSDDGDGNRDRRLVRDLLFAAYNMNNHFSEAGLDVNVYATLRSEILGSIKLTTQELGKIIDAFGVNLNWYNDNIDNHPVVNIFENKIRLSEIEYCGSQSGDPLSVYLPDFVGQKDIRRYLLDAGLHRPRGVLLRLKAAAELAFGKSSISSADFLSSENSFGEAMLEEFTEEISASFDESSKAAILGMFRGKHFAFTVNDLEIRLRDAAVKDKSARNLLRDYGINEIVRLLFRVGMIGNQFEIKEHGYSKVRDVWSFRGAADPIMDQRFVLHLSVRKALISS